MLSASVPSTLFRVCCPIVGAVRVAVARACMDLSSSGKAASATLATTATAVHGIFDEECPVTTAARCSPTVRTRNYMGQCLTHRPIPAPVSDAGPLKHTLKAAAHHNWQATFLQVKRRHERTPRSSQPPTLSHRQTNGLPNRTTTICKTKRTTLERKILTRATQQFLVLHLTRQRPTTSNSTVRERLQIAVRNS